MIFLGIGFHVARCHPAATGTPANTAKAAETASEKSNSKRGGGDDDNPQQKTSGHQSSSSLQQVVISLPPPFSRSNGKTHARVQTKVCWCLLSEPAPNGRCMVQKKGWFTNKSSCLSHEGTWQHFNMCCFRQHEPKKSFLTPV